MIAVRFVVCVVCVVSALYNVPRWFEYRPQTQTTFNETNTTRLVAAGTWLATDPIYVRVYYSWLYLPVMCIVPLVALSTINASLVLAVRRSRADRKRMNVRQCRENNVTLMLVSVVAVFIVCQVRLYLAQHHQSVINQSNQICPARRFTKAQMRKFFHTMKALTSYHVSATLIVIENRNSGLRYAGKPYVQYITASKSGGVYVHLLLPASCENEYRN